MGIEDLQNYYSTNLSAKLSSYYVVGDISKESVLKGLEIIGADLQGLGIDTLKKIPKNWVLAMGSEAHGLSNDVKAQLDQTITIPKIGIGESLNVGVAMGILLYRLTQ